MNLKGFEFGLRTSAGPQSVNKAELGLGNSSTFLRTLAKGGFIASQMYSFFWGTEVASETRDGSLTLGGYDEALITGLPNTTTSFDRTNQQCREGMIVQISGLVLQTPEGEKSDVMAGLGETQACVVPTLSRVLSLPTVYWEKMQKFMGVELSPYGTGTSGGIFYSIVSIKPESAYVNHPPDSLKLY